MKSCWRTFRPFLRLFAITPGRAEPLAIAQLQSHKRRERAAVPFLLQIKSERDGGTFPTISAYDRNAERWIHSLRLIVILKLAVPDVTETHRVSVILEHQPASRRMGMIDRECLVQGLAHQLRVIVNYNAVVHDRDAAGLRQLAIRESGGGEKDIIGLPFAGLSAGVHQRRVLSV